MRRGRLGCGGPAADPRPMLRFAFTTLVGAALLFLPAAVHL
jgi:hypothetical protein